MTTKDDAAPAADDDALLATEADSQSQTSGDEDTAAAEQADLEARARRIGWRPLDEFRGDPKKHIPAREYVERGEQSLPIIIERNRRLDDRLAKTDAELKATNARLGEAIQGFQEFRRFNANAEQRGYDRAKRELEARMETAAANADVPAHREALAELRELEKNRPAGVVAAETGDDRSSDARTPERRTAAPQQPKISPATQAWADENTTIMGDPVLYNVAVEAHGENLKAGMSEDESYGKLRLQVEQRAPWKFDNPRRAAAAAVTPPSPPRGPKRGRAFDDLPKDAKDAYARFARLDPKFTKDQYLADYEWDK